MGLRRNAPLCALAMSVALLCSGCDWLGWASNAAHSGTVVDSALDATAVSALVASPVFTSPPTAQIVTGHGMLFVTRNGTLTALDEHSHGLVWAGRLPAGATAGTVPMVDTASNTVFLAVSTATQPVLLGFDLDGVRNCNPNLYWCEPVFRAGLGSTAAPATPPVVADGRVFANGASRLYAFDAAASTGCTVVSGTSNCTPLWSSATGSVRSGVGPAAVGGVVYDPMSASGVGSVSAFDAGNGQLMWKGTLPLTFATAAPSGCERRTSLRARRRSSHGVRRQRLWYSDVRAGLRAHVAPR